METVESIVEQVYKLDAEGNPRAASKVIMCAIISCYGNDLFSDPFSESNPSFVKPEWQEIDRLLTSFDLEKLGTHSISAMLRLTAKHYRCGIMPSWRKVYDAAVPIMKQRGHDPESVFAGLNVK